MSFFVTVQIEFYIRFIWKEMIKTWTDDLHVGMTWMFYQPLLELYC